MSFESKSMLILEVRRVDYVIVMCRLSHSTPANNGRTCNVILNVAGYEVELEKEEKNGSVKGRKLRCPIRYFHV